MLLAAGAEVDARDDDGETPLYEVAFGSGEPAVLQALIEAGSEVNARDNRGNTALRMAAVTSNPKATEVLLAAGADVNARTDGGWTPLYSVLFANQQELSFRPPENGEAVVRLLLAAGADVHATALQQAVINGNLNVIDALLNAPGTDVDVRNDAGETSLHTAVYASWRTEGAVVQALLAAGADPNARDADGNTPLHWWVERDADSENLDALLHAGADLDARNDDGWTPLHYAAANDENPAVIETLLDAGADRRARNVAGDLPWDLLQRNEHLRVTEEYRRLSDALFVLP